MSIPRTVQNEPNLIHLLHRASQYAEALFERIAPNASLTARQLVVLDAIAALSDPSQTEICKHCGIDRSTLADIVRRLVNRKLVTRRRTREDARRYALRLTPEGADQLKNNRPALQAVDREIAALTNQREQRALLDALIAIGKAADDMASTERAG